MEIMEKIKIKRVRSPNYPVLDLKDAIERARKLYDREKTIPMHSEVALQNLGYSEASGSGFRVLSALRQYGLLEEQKGSLKISQIAVDLFFMPQSDERYSTLLSSIALNPKLFKELYNLYKGLLPSEASLKYKLITDYKFNPDSVESFILSYIKTLEFAGLANNEEIKETNTEELETPENEIHGSSNIGLPTERVNAKGNILKPQSFDIPLLRQNKATITIQKLPVEKTDIERLKKWIDLMEDSLIENEEVDEAEKS